jgi:L-ascorbate metabolism protein UlaG (beta-lactamase superfamily)
MFEFNNIIISWLGHSGIKLSFKNKIIYIDPYHLKDSKEKADYILITHGHYDHCDIEQIKTLVKKDTTILCTPDVQSKLSFLQMDIRVILVEPGSLRTFENIKIWAIRAYNLSKEFHKREEDWVGFIISLNDTFIYVAGDTDLIPEMKSVKADIVFLPISGTYTMNAGEAAKSATLIKPKIAFPIHWGDMIGSRKDAEVFLKLCSAEGIEARILEKE